MPPRHDINTDIQVHSRGNRSVSGATVCGALAALQGPGQAQGPSEGRPAASAPTSLSFLSATLKEFHAGELVPGLLGAPLPFPSPLLSSLSSWVTAISCLPETWKEGGLSPQPPPESLASPDAKRTFFSQFSYVREGI